MHVPYVHVITYLLPEPFADLSPEKNDRKSTLKSI